MSRSGPTRLAKMMRRALILMRDVTALRRGEQMRADFVANVSHELRTPLTSLVGFIETLRGPARGDIEAQDRFLEPHGRPVQPDDTDRE